MASKFGCRHDPDVCRRHESELATLAQFSKDFLLRYESDRKACEERYRTDRDEARSWRKQTDDRLDDLTKFIQELRPAYKRLMGLAGIIILGALAIIWQIVWTHVTR